MSIYTINVHLRTHPCANCGESLVDVPYVENRDDVTHQLIEQGACIGVNTPYYGNRYVCQACADAAPTVWCIGCHEPATKHGIFEQSDSDPSKCLCQRCYQTLTAIRFDDLRHELEGGE